MQVNRYRMMPSMVQGTLQPHPNGELLLLSEVQTLLLNPMLKSLDIPITTPFEDIPDAISRRLMDLKTEAVCPWCL